MASPLLKAKVFIELYLDQLEQGLALQLATSDRSAHCLPKCLQNAPPVEEVYPSPLAFIPTSPLKEQPHHCK